MVASACLPFAELRVAALALQAAEGAAEIVAEARRFRSTAGALCDSVVILIDAAARDETAGAVFAAEALTLPVERLIDGRDALLSTLRRSCLYCGGRSPFDLSSH
ncbi:MAG: hypothetical protein HY985_11240 [Magnetospirillum sp.]|nr:hypothetical protein [Magnetospirillum sp.]